MINKHMAKIDKMVFPEQNDTYITAEGSEIDWEKTSIYPLGGMGNLCINLKGRDPQGCIEPSEKENLINNFKESLKKLTDENNQPLIEHLFTKEEVFAGPHLEKAPDLVLYSEKNVLYYYPHLDKLDQPTVSPDIYPYWSGNHDITGIWAAQGPNIKSSHQQNCEIIDLMPTFLHYLNIPIPSDCDGKVVTEIFTEPIANREIHTYNPVPNTQDKGKALSEKEKEELNKRLENLGYLA